jgi:hypothetical protein
MQGKNPNEERLTEDENARGKLGRGASPAEIPRRTHHVAEINVRDEADYKKTFLPKAKARD